MSNTAIPTCCGQVVINYASGKEFYYCRGCKQEVTAKPADTDVCPRTHDAHRYVEFVDGRQCWDCGKAAPLAGVSKQSGLGQTSSLQTWPFYAADSIPLRELRVCGLKVLNINIPEQRGMLKIAATYVVGKGNERREFIIAKTDFQTGTYVVFRAM